VLRSADFTGDFELSSAEGTTLRMAADGSVQVERDGDVAHGRSAQVLRVRRELGQVADGIEVRYVVSNEGIDERGVPGVRLATVEGLLTETDAFGRYHVTGVDGGGARGRNFIVKVDPGTLPPGTELTTPNPLVQRITPGVPVRFDFGARLPDGELRASGLGVAVELGEVLFDADSAEVTADNADALDDIAARLVEAGGGVVTIHATAEGSGLAFARAEAVRAALDARLPAELRDAVRIELVTDEAPAPAAVLQDTVALGDVLFELGSDTVRTRYAPLLDSVAARIARAGGGSVHLVGRTDRSGSSAFNQALGLRRARAVFDALASRLPDALRAQLRVDITEGPDAGTGAGER
jgi:outer membrane protein OmpA-like peptidoglycan-associated protein